MTAGPANLDSLLDGAVERHRGRPALAFGEGRLSYEGLSVAVDRLAERLGTLVPRRGSERSLVAVVAPNVPALPVAMFAIWRVGGVAVPLSARLREYELRHILGDANPAILVCIESWKGYSFAELVPELLAGVPSLRSGVVIDADGEVVEELSGAGPGAPASSAGPETAAILYTSGTTGQPKGALVKEESALHWGQELAGVLELQGQDVSLLVIPVSHAFGFICLLTVVASGGLGVLVDSTFSLGSLLEAAARHEATVLHGSPGLFTGVLKARPDGIPGIRTGLVGGAASSPELIQRLEDTGATILNVFGMTEIGAASVCRSTDPASVRFTTVGCALPGYEFRIVPRAREAGELGEVQVRGPHVTPGYFGQPERTAEAFDGEWLRTGDLGSLDAGGHLTIAGRSKELVHVSGFNVFPGEVEAFLLIHPDVEQVAVVGVPHRQTGEGLHAFVVRRESSGLEPADLIRFARSRIAGYKLPYAITMVRELPLLTSGKPDRTALLHSAKEVSAPA